MFHLANQPKPLVLQRVIKTMVVMTKAAMRELTLTKRAQKMPLMRRRNPKSQRVCLRSFRFSCDSILICVIVHVEDGESGEATLVQLRAKLFALDSKEAGWKERGIGTLKVNVPRSCASFDENGVAIPGSFDVSGLEDEEEEEESNGPRVPRLIMRQENTHRVILNTIIVKAMEFKDKPSTSTAQILFTAFEGEKEPKPINMLLKVSIFDPLSCLQLTFCQMSETNARAFRAEIGSIQREL
jgi:hypothetical protein